MPASCERLVNGAQRDRVDVNERQFPTVGFSAENEIGNQALSKYGATGTNEDQLKTGSHNGLLIGMEGFNANPIVPRGFSYIRQAQFKGLLSSLGWLFQPRGRINRVVWNCAMKSKKRISRGPHGGADFAAVRQTRLMRCEYDVVEGKKRGNIEGFDFEYVKPGASNPAHAQRIRESAFIDKLPRAMLIK